MELTRAQEAQLRRTGREALERAVAAASNKQQSGVTRVTAEVTAVNSNHSIDVNLGTDGYKMPLTGLRYTTDCAKAKVGDRVVVDTSDHVPMVTGIVASTSDSSACVKLWSTTLDNPSTGAGVNAPTLSGWNFLFWLQPASVGFVGSAYIERVYNQSANLWICDGGTGSWRVTAVYLREDIKVEGNDSGSALTDAIKKAVAAASSANSAASSANSAASSANSAATAAGKVNATLSGSTLTVTDRNGNSTSTNVKGDAGPQGPQGLPGPTFAAGAGVVGFYVNEEGHLICVKGEDVTDSYELRDGHLYLTREL